MQGSWWPLRKDARPRPAFAGPCTMRLGRRGAVCSAVLAGGSVFLMLGASRRAGWYQHVLLLDVALKRSETPGALVLGFRRAGAGLLPPPPPCLLISLWHFLQVLPFLFHVCCVPVSLPSLVASVLGLHSVGRFCCPIHGDSHRLETCRPAGPMSRVCSKAVWPLFSGGAASGPLPRASPPRDTSAVVQVLEAQEGPASVHQDVQGAFRGCPVGGPAEVSPHHPQDAGDC